MTKIKEIVKIHSGYSDTVKLKEEFESETQNTQRMSNYRPIRSHRDAFKVIAEAPFIRDSKRCFVLSGSYGTGKSHLALMAANYYNKPSISPEMEYFFKHYSEAENEEKEENKKADILKNRRRTGKFLVCICDYLSHDFESAVLRSIKDSLNKEKINIEEIDSYYLQAIWKIEMWEGMSDQFFINRFNEILENDYGQWTINKIKKGLTDYDKNAVEIFKDIHKKITTTEFEYDKDNLVEIVKQMTKSNKIREKFKGVAIIFDEFDYMLKNRRFDLEVFQKFGEMCEESFMNNFPVLFVATTHRSFVSYKGVYNDADFKTVSDRVYEIPMETSGIEDIIAAIVVPEKNSDIWENEIMQRKATFNELANECSNLKIFNWLSKHKLRNRIIENIYPMHPLATYALIKLSKDMASNNRSVFKFFASEDNENGSYDWFVKNNEILNNRGGLRLYTVDNLFYYFEDKFTSDNTELRNTAKEKIRDYETTIREFNKFINNPDNLIFQSDIYSEILTTMVIYSLIDLQINFANIKFGLNLSGESDERELEFAFITLQKNKIIFKNDSTKSYEFRMSDTLDVRALIKEKIEDENNQIDNLFNEIENLRKNNDVRHLKKFFKDNDYLMPNTYNVVYSEDKRLKIQFATLKDIQNKDYFAKLNEEIDKNLGKDGYEGVALYIVCETHDEIKKARNVADINKFNRILIGIPEQEIPIYDEAMGLKAALQINTQDFSTQDVVLLREEINRYDNNLSKGLTEYLDSKKIIYFGIDGKVLANKSNNKSEAADRVMENIYLHRRNDIKHEHLNSIHKFKDKGDTALKDAVENLLNFSRDVMFNTLSAADSGDTRYIRKVLYNTGAIKEIKREGDWIICNLNLEPNDYKRDLPALTDMIKSISNTKDDINITCFINRYINEYGLGYNAIILYFAVLLRYFKDNIMIIPDINEVGSLNIQSYDTLLDLLFYRKYRNGVIRYKQLSQNDRFLINEISKVFMNNYNISLDNITVDKLYSMLKGWYEVLSPINKVKSVYKNKLDVFIDRFNRIDKVGSHDFVLEGIKIIYGYELDGMIFEEDVLSIVKKFKNDKSLIEEGYYIVKKDLLESLKKLFNSKAITEEGFMEDIKQWYTSLTDLQRNPETSLQDEESRPIARLFAGQYTFERLFMEQLPALSGYQLGMVKNWTEDRKDMYINKIGHGKQHIERICIVEEPEYILGNTVTNKYEISKTEMKVYYNRSVDITIRPKDGHRYIYLTSNESNPKNNNSQRLGITDEYVYRTDDNKTIKFVAVDNEGRYSNVIEINLENEEKKYEVKVIPPEQVAEQLGIKELGEENKLIIPVSPKVEVALPKDRDSLKKCLSSLFSASKEKYKITKGDLILVLQELLKEM